MEPNRIEHRPPKKVDVIKVIKIQSLRGDGTENNPVRNIYQYFDLNGTFLFETDVTDLR